MSYPPKEYYDEDAKKMRLLWTRIGWLVRFPLAAVGILILIVESVFVVTSLDEIPEVWDWAVNGGEVTL